MRRREINLTWLELVQFSKNLCQMKAPTKDKIPLDPKRPAQTEPPLGQVAPKGTWMRTGWGGELTLYARDDFSALTWGTPGSQEYVRAVRKERGLWRVSYAGRDVSGGLFAFHTPRYGALLAAAPRLDARHAVLARLRAFNETISKTGAKKQVHAWLKAMQACTTRHAALEALPDGARQALLVALPESVIHDGVEEILRRVAKKTRPKADKAA